MTESTALTEAKITGVTITLTRDEAEYALHVLSGAVRMFKMREIQDD